MRTASPTAGRRRTAGCGTYPENSQVVVAWANCGSRKRRADEPGDELAVRLTLEAGHGLLHHAAHVLLRGGSRLGYHRLDDRRDFVLPQLRRKVLLQQLELLLLVLGKFRAPRRGELRDRLLALLRALREDGEIICVFLNRCFHVFPCMHY